MPYVRCQTQAGIFPRLRVCTSTDAGARVTGREFAQRTTPRLASKYAAECRGLTKPGGCWPGTS